MKPLGAVALLASMLAAQGEGRREANATSLGLVVFERGGKVVVHEALEGGPAAEAGVRPGDVLVKAGPTRVERHNDLDAALRAWPKEKKIELDLVRGGKDVHILVLPRADLDHPYVRRAARTTTGFAAPPWHAFAWVNVPRGADPPTKASTKGKVVVIHCFQAWSPGCAAWGFPVHKRVAEKFREADDVVCFHLQTVWEGQQVNTPESNAAVAKKFRIEAPIGYDAHVDGRRLSIFAEQYAIGGTPWTVVIDRTGKVVFNAVTPKEVGEITGLVEKLRKPGRVNSRGG